MEKGIIGVSGEYFVAAELSQRGYVATLTLKNTPKVDILATNLETGKYFNIQVKTMSVGNNTGWRLGPKDEVVSDIQNHFYIMVNLKGVGLLPEYYVIPQKELAEYIYKDHRSYLERGGKDSSIRVFDPHKRSKDFGGKFKENWELLDSK